LSSPDAIIPHGVDLAEFTPAQNRDALWESLGHGGEFGIGIFGRVRESKGVDLLVRAAIPILQKDPRPTIVIIGETLPKDEMYRAQLQREIEAAGLNRRILFLGKLPFSEVKRYFQGVSMVASLSRNEGYGLTVLEAMASGAAVMATKTGAWEEILKDQPESIVSEHTVVAVAKVLESKLASDDLQPEGLENREYVTTYYSIEKETRELSAYYAKIAQSK